MNSIRQELQRNLDKGLITIEQFLKANVQYTELLEKGGKRAMIEEIRTFGGREYIKTAQGWKFYGKGTGAKAQQHAMANNTKPANKSTSSSDSQKSKEQTSGDEKSVKQQQEESNTPSIEIASNVIKNKKEIENVVKKFLANKNNPSIAKVSVVSGQGPYSMDGESTAIRLISKKGNEIVHHFVHKQYGHQNTNKMGEPRPPEAILRQDGRATLRLGYGDEGIRSLKQIEQRNLSLPSLSQLRATTQQLGEGMKKRFPNAFLPNDQASSRSIIDYEGRVPRLDPQAISFSIKSYDRTGPNYDVVVNLIDNIATLNYGAQTGGTVDTREHRAINIKIDGSKPIDQILQQAIESKEWESIKKEIDVKRMRYAKSFGDYVRRIGTKSGIGNQY